MEGLVEEGPGGWRELIFVGIVERVGPPPAQWSGPLASYQEVRYVVDETIKGDPHGSRLAVIHPVVRDSPTAEPGDVPGLSSRLFRLGARLLVMGFEHSGGRCRAPSEHFGAIPYSRLLAEQLRAVVVQSAETLLEDRRPE
jgi:hypothetical protein